jgi:hypothetical protein
MSAIRASLAALLFAASAPAHAQEQSWETSFLLIANPCLESQGSNKLQVCEQANRDLVNKAASHVGPLPKHEDNVYRAMRGMLFLSIAAEMGKADGARSKRSCESIEKAWIDVSLIDTQYSPERAADLQSIKSEIVKAARVCNREFGKIQPWTPDLPAN